ncbi:hypothetical protein [Streptacidiphilus jiangxiensis]|uniref:Uncharacterized protein n=1 Tax=Streptacidiphilus jiangxiensis TaxID=235985 RepID=A0A1H7L984_STRJI|nr:hypothetical protein [Streptacidiphilus jiangxiensis]SEK95414.1 hypothetical protein SAMN05414137_104400 [Streptacidiphilus jiangxiensis]
MNAHQLPNDPNTAGTPSTPSAPRARHLSLAGLRHRGWTPSMVAKLLGPPDLTVRNPHFRGAAPSRLYAVARVEAAEATDAFAALATAASRRAGCSRLASERRRRQILAEVEGVRIQVPRLTPECLTRRAVAHRNQRDAQRACRREDHHAAPARADAAEPGALRRWQVNYLRHALTEYDAVLDGLHGAAGRVEAEQALRRRVYEAIGATYPHLAAECRRQLKERQRPDRGG